MENYEKKYKEALERAKNINNEHRAQPFNVMTRVFPELKDTESEDEKTRKELYEFCMKCSHGDTLVNQQADFQRWAAWLEKQGEKSADEIIEALRTEYEKGRADAITEMQGNQNLALSEEDERMCQETIDWFEKKCFPYALPEENPAKYSIIWLKTLKERMKGE